MRTTHSERRGGSVTSGSRSGPPFIRRGNTMCIKEIMDRYNCEPGEAVRIAARQKRRRLEWRETALSLFVAFLVLGFAALAAFIIIMTAKG